jgi:prepilin-type N-terminal cleavage/methylation domain-containing protein
MKKVTLKGFTLIEVLITLVIIAVLVGITVVALNPGDKINTANDVKIKADLTQLANAFTLYRNETGDTPFTASGTPSTNVIAAGTSLGAPFAAANAGATPPAPAFDDKAFCTNIVATRRILASMPLNPKPPTGVTTGYTSCTAYKTGYDVEFDGTIVKFSAALSDGSTFTIER